MTGASLLITPGVDHWTETAGEPLFKNKIFVLFAFNNKRFVSLGYKQHRHEQVHPSFYRRICSASSVR